MARELDEDEKALLTPEELAAMAEDGAEELDMKVLAADVDEDDDEDEADEPPAAPAAPEAAKPEAPVAPAVTEAPALVPSFTDADKAQLETIEAKRAEIAQLADDGELSFKEAQEKLKAIDDEVAPLLRKRFRDEERAAIYEEQNQEAWNGAVGSFLAAAKVDPSKLTDAQWDQLDAISQSLTGSPALVKGMTMDQQVQEVFRLYDAQNPGAWAGEKPWEKPRQRAKADPKVNDPKAGNEVQVPPSLGGLPHSDPGGGVEDGRWAALDRLSDTDPLKFEVALAKLSPADRDAYLAA